MDQLRLNVNRGNDSNCRSLFVAVESGDLGRIETILQNGTVVNCVESLAGIKGNSIIEAMKSFMFACDEWREIYTPLHVAVDKGNEEVVTLLVSHSANVNAEAGDCLTPLHLASKGGHLRIVEHLLNHGASIDSVSSRLGYTPLHFACEGGNFEVISLLLSKGAHVNTAGSTDNVTPLHIATKNGHEQVVRLLLEHGALVDSLDKHGKTTLSYAVEKGNLIIVEDVLKYNPDRDIPTNRNSLLNAVRSHKEAIVKALLNYGFNVSAEDANDTTLFHGAITNGHIQIVDDLLKYGADINELHSFNPLKTAGENKSEKEVMELIYISMYNFVNESFTPLQCATKYKQKEVAELLIKYGANINAENRNKETAIHFALANSDLEMIKLLLSHGANVKDKPSLFNLAIAGGQIEVVEELLKHEVDVKAYDQFGRTALHCAAHAKDSNADIAKLLLSRGADVDAKSKLRTTTLHDAIVRGREKLVETLLEYNATLECDLYNGTTLLHVSAGKGNAAITEMILCKGLDVNVTTDNGSTALHIASEKGHKEVIKLLLKFGAKSDLKMKNSCTPLHLIKTDDSEIIETLLKFGADIKARDEKGRTALHSVSYKGLRKSVQVLLEHGSDINETCLNDLTPLNYAWNGLKEREGIIFEDGSYCYEDEDRKYDDEIDEYSSTADYLHRYVAKMQVENFYLNKKNLDSVEDLIYLSDFQSECKAEIFRMKNEIIKNTNISFYDMLSKDDGSLAIFTRNTIIEQALKADDYETKFPIYADLLKSQLRKGLVRKDLLEESINICHNIFHYLPGLSDVCDEKIFPYLTNEDLRNLIESCKRVNN